MKKIFILFMATIFFLSLSVNSVMAGSEARHRLQGVIIGLGAAVLGNAIINSYQQDRETVVERDVYYHPKPPRHSRSYCETQRIWIPQTYEKVWNPGHYERGQWVQGQYVMIQKIPGHWVEERVCRNYR